MNDEKKYRKKEKNIVLAILWILCFTFFYVCEESWGVMLVVVTIVLFVLLFGFKYIYKMIKNR